jgi:membrane protease YdiL (CAAX protease family)
MIVSRRLAWLILLGGILTAGILRQFHETIPSSPFLPWPIRSLLFFLVLVLFLTFARGWGRRQEIPYAGAGLTRVNFLAFVPLLIALMLEKWVSITFYRPLFYTINGTEMPSRKFDALYVIDRRSVCSSSPCSSSLSFAASFRCSAAIWPHPGSSWRSGIAVGLAGVFGGLAALLTLSGAEGFALRWSGFGRWSVLILAGQALIAMAEELYYRGLLQTELAFLLPSLGVGRRRVRWLTAVLLISLAFAIEHVVWSESPSQDVRRFVFTLGCAFFLGTLMALLDNLWLNAACHLVLNFFSLGLDPATRGGGLQFVNDVGQPIFEPSIYISLFLILIFIFAYGRIAMSHRRAAARLADSSSPAS